MSLLEVWTFRVLVIAAVALFGVQMATRIRLVADGPRNLSADRLPERVRRFVVDVLLQARVIRSKPWVGFAHLFVFWGFVAFAGFTLVESLRGLGIIDLSETGWFHAYRIVLTPFAVAVLIGILFLLGRRVIVRPPALGRTVSKESVLIGLFIAALMATFLLDLRLEGVEARVNWWAHMVVILAFLVLIPDSKHLHLILSPITVFLKSPVLGDVPNLDFEREEVGFEAVKDLPAKQRLDAFTCVECGRCQEACPAFATGKLLNPKKLILDAERAMLAGRLDAKLVDLFDENVLWQCTTCGACESQCPVGIEHLPLIIGARRGLVSNGEAPGYLGPVFNGLERRGNIWGLTYDQRDKFLASTGVETFDPARHTYLVWLGCAGAFEADYQKALRALFELLRAHGATFGVLAKERCNGDPAKRTGNEYMFQELATQNVEELQRAGATKIVTSCPHCLKTLGEDYRAFGFNAEVVHSAVLMAELTRGVQLATDDEVTFHDPCYLGRYGGHTEEPRALLQRVGAKVREPVRSRDNPFCCGAGGGLLFEEQEPGKRISQERLEQLQATGAGTVVMACPFCSIMLKGARASAQASTEMVDLMSYVNGKLRDQGVKGPRDRG
ncbi:MAG: 4Fe-4S dicluster domain-containing protein [Luteitalea sp.]|nr:4Fe-4S dicluster domain-containing protein [Luteitalea sp.]